MKHNKEITDQNNVFIRGFKIENGISEYIVVNLTIDSNGYNFSFIPEFPIERFTINFTIGK